MTSNTSRGPIPFVCALGVSLVIGPLISALPFLRAFPLTLWGVTGSDLLRLLFEFASLLILCIVALPTFRAIPDNGKGGSFARGVFLPLTTMAILLIAGKTLRVAGQPLIALIGPQRYSTGYTVVLIAATLWLTVEWWRHLDALDRFFSPHQPVRPPAQPKPSLDDTTPVTTGTDPPTQSFSASAMRSETESPPATLGRYKILKELGRGAMGVVYLGKDPTIQRFVAIKTMRLSDIEDDTKLREVKARFFREAESTGRLSHPNIVTIYDAGEEQDLAYLAMETLEGTTLKAWSQPPNLLPVGQLIPILATVADALDYAHQQGVVHRDIKPANIMVTNEQIVKVMDFGIAKTSSASKTQTDVVLGTPTYMSPEQIAGKKVDGRSDLFSLGLVLYELLSGAPAFTADNLSTLLYAITHHPHPPITAIRTDLSPALTKALDCALQKDPVHRFRRAAEFAQALRASVREQAA